MHLRDQGGAEIPPFLCPTACTTVASAGRSQVISARPSRPACVRGFPVATAASVGSGGPRAITMFPPPAGSCIRRTSWVWVGAGLRDHRVRRRAGGGISWPGPLADDPSLGELLDTIKAAGLALGADRALPLFVEVAERLPREPGLYAVHGEAQAWDQLQGLRSRPTSALSTWPAPTRPCRSSFVAAMTCGLRLGRGATGTCAPGA